MIDCNNEVHYEYEMDRFIYDMIINNILLEDLIAMRIKREEYLRHQWYIIERDI